MNGFFAQIFVFARRNQVVTVSAFLFVLLGVADYFLWQRQAEIIRVHDRIQKESDATLMSLSGQGRLQSQLNLVQDAMTHIENNLVVETDLASNSDYFYQIEKSSGARVTDLNQLNSQPAGEDNPYRSIPFSVRLSGSYTQVMTFLRGLETGPRLLKIKRFSFARSVGSADVIALDLNVEMLGHP